MKIFALSSPAPIQIVVSSGRVASGLGHSYIVHGQEAGFETGRYIPISNTPTTNDYVTNGRIKMPTVLTLRGEHESVDYAQKVIINLIIKMSIMKGQLQLEKNAYQNFLKLWRDDKFHGQRQVKSFIITLCCTNLPTKNNFEVYMKQMWKPKRIK